MDDIDRHKQREDELYDQLLASPVVELTGIVSPSASGAEDSDEIEPCLKVARTLWSQESSWKTRTEEYAVRMLLPLKNESWLGEDEAELSPEEFKSKMTLRSISIYPDGEFDFLHHDGDLFWGHSIQICGNLTEGLTDADIPG